MGSGRWDPSAWTGYASSTVNMSTDKIYATHTKEALYSKKPELLPRDPVTKDARLRESRDSEDNPESTPIIVAIDVTGSMGMLAETLARKGLGTLFQEILDRKPVSDPHIMFMAVGDANHDSVPLQVSQFEADARIIEQLTGIYLEGGGGGNHFESYDLAWYFAGQHTVTDAFEKRRKKGYLFTVGDEPAPPRLTADQIREFIGDDVPQNIPSEDSLAMAERMYNVFHLVVEEGSHARSNIKGVMDSWNNILGQHVLRMSDHSKMSEIIVSAIQVNEGMDKGAVVGSWSGDTSLVVRNAIQGLTVPGKTGAGVIRM